MMAVAAPFFRQRAEEFTLALGLLTRFPLPTFEVRTPATPATAFWAYPLAGALIGLVAAATFWLSVSLGFNTIVSAILAVIAGLFASGGLHEDGLSDFWDGLGGGRTREAKLTIMRDSRVGTYGALSLFLGLGLQIAFLVNLHHYAGLFVVAAALIASESAARGAIALPLGLLGSARHEGLGGIMLGVRPSCLAIGGALAVAVAVALLSLQGVVLIFGAVLGAALITVLARGFLGGFTGDVLGAAAATARITALGALVLMVTP